MDLVGNIGVAIGANVAGYTDGMKQVEQSTRQATQTIQSTWTSTLSGMSTAWTTHAGNVERASGRTEGASRRTKVAAEGLGSVLNEWVRAERQEQRTAGFMGRWVAGLIPATNASTAALSQFVGLLGQAAIGGIGFGLAMESVAFAVMGISKIYEGAIADIKQAREEQAQFLKDLVTISDELDKKERKRLAIKSGMRPEVAEAVFSADDAKLAEMEVQWGNKKLELERQWAEELEKQYPNANKIYELAQQVAEAERNIAAARSQSTSLINVARGAAQEAVNWKKQEGALALAQASVEKELALGVSKQKEIALRAAVELRTLELQIAKAVKDNDVESIPALVRRKEAIVAAMNAQIAAIRMAQEAARELNREFDFFGAEAAAAGEYGKAMIEAEKLDTDRRKAKGKAMLDWAQDIGSRMGQILSQTFEGGFKPLVLLRGVLAEAFGALREYVIKSVMASAVDAAGKAASSQASVPFAGPVLAAAALSAMFALVLGLIGSIPSAAQGFDVPTSVNPITQLHGGEMVLPRDIADQVRNSTARGGGGPRTVVVNALDGASVRRVLRSRRGELARALRELSDDRRSG